ncbi:MAG: HTTM domain-containing protein [Myxococcota bacterium]
MATERGSPRSLLDDLFGVDLRALAAFRIALGLLVLFDLVTRGFFLADFYTDAGILAREFAPFSPATSPTSLHTLGGSLAWVGVLHAVGLVGAACLTVGWKTPVAKTVTYLTILSLFWRNPGAMNGGDYLVMVQLFWCLFLPVGERCSVDASRSGRSGRSGPGRELSIATAALLLQIALLYLFSTFHKAGGAGWFDGTAAWYAVSHEVWQRPLGAFLAELPIVMKLFTWSVLVYEFIGPLLLFSPIWTGPLRVLTLAGFVALQVGLGFSMQLWLFPWISTLSLLPFLPSPLLDAAERRFGRVAKPGAGADRPPRAGWRRGLAAVLSALAFGYVFFSHVERTLPGWRPPAALSRAGRWFGLNQGPAMYSRERRYDVIFGLRGTRADGATFVVDDAGATVSWPPVARLRSFYRGKLYLERQVEWEFPSELAGLADWACRVWNDAHAPA